MTRSRSTNTIGLYDRYVMPTYTKTPLVIERARGSTVWDAEGVRYLDMFPGWGVSGVGHCPPRVAQAVARQVKRLMHVSNNYFHAAQALLAQRLSERAFDGKVFFSNSGAEANEAAIKLTRKFGGPDRYEILTTENSFHGRTLATVTATGQPKYQAGFDPLVPGFRSVPFNDLEAMRRAVTHQTGAILVEPVQGEGGIQIAAVEYLRGLRQLCDARDLLLIVDEVQTGLGRTGRWFAYQHAGIVPDVMTLAKTLGGGIPIGATVVARPNADLMGPGTHASTFGGSPVACAAALAVIETIERGRLVERAARLGRYAVDRLQALQRRHRIIRAVRGLGLMLAVELSVDGRPIVEACRKEGLLINCTQERVLRLLPALTVTQAELARALKMLDEVLASRAGRSGLRRRAERAVR
ncbi:MAG: aspartate aminotransferase family protein [Candidatus Omnitrophica bacterium]|nr:aspartate aminotransferase family protein [Candidatus Omnitrophota bacterium]